MKLAKLFSFLLMLALPLIVWAGMASAQSFRSGNTVTVSKGESVDSSLWTSGKTIDIAGNVNGDVFCAGQNVTISGTVRGDLVCAAQTINISGTVEGSIRTAAQNLSIGGKAQRSLSAVAQTATLEGNGSIDRDASFAAQDTNLHGTIGRDLALASQNTTISGSIGRNIKANVDQLNITGQAEINGSVDYTSANKAEVDQGSQIGGELIRTEPAEEDKGTGTGGVGFDILASLVLLASVLILVLLFPRAFHRAANNAVENPVKTLLIGLAAMFAAPILIFGIMITIIGIPLGLLALAVWILILALSGAFAAYYLGRMIWQTQTNPVLIMLAGAALLLLLRFIPIIGVLATLLAIWLGSGMLLQQLGRMLQKPQYDTRKLK